MVYIRNLEPVYSEPPASKAQAEKIVIKGQRPLKGEISVSGCKNSAVAIMPAAMLSDGICEMDNMPYIEDTFVLKSMMEALGAKVSMPGGGKVIVDPRGVNNFVTPQDLAQRMRASTYMFGILLGRLGEAIVPMPGGCDIGERAIDQHIKGLEALGTTFELKDCVYHARTPGLIGREIYLDMPSVGATINIMLAACRAQGRTVIGNAAREPHVVDLANFLNSMGAGIKGAGTDIIRVVGVPKLHGTSYTILPDQIEAGTLMIAAAATGGDVLVLNVIPIHMESLSAKLMETGVHIKEYDNAIHIRGTGDRLRPVNIKTQPYPGFPTDLQQPATALLSTASGISVVTETIFESRFKYIEELKHMGADVRVIDNVAVVNGVPRLYGARVTATDLRAGAALVIAGLAAQGQTEIFNINYIDRGYENIEFKLRHLGADIRRLPI